MLSRNSIPVLMYHHVSPEGRGISISPSVFEDHVRFLKRSGWRTLRGDEFIEVIHQKKIKERYVVLTFDDGFADNYVYAYPILKRYGMKAILFVTTSFIEDIDIKRDGFKPLPHEEAWGLAFTERRHEVMCTWNELREMEGSGVFDIQAHSHTHNTPSYIKGKRYSELREDLLVCKKLLKERLSKEIQHLSWPKGCYDYEAIRIATGAGFNAIYTTERGANTAGNLREIRRLSVKRGGRWLINRLNIYSSTFLSRLYLFLRWG
ncbi:MAG: polysaccharide deacetylase family protein [Thermodesulfovibrionia bacterium]